MAVSQAEGRGFETRRPLSKALQMAGYFDAMVRTFEEAERAA